MSRKKSGGSNGANDSTANLGFEAKLWLAAHTVPSDSDTSECNSTLRAL
jgi:hypothetical protein